jgi:hypothetical protein
LRKKSLTKEQRELQIIQWFAGRIQDNNDTSLASLAQIGRGLGGLSPSSHLRSICEGLVDRKVLVAKEFKRSGRWQGRGYRLNKSAYKRPATRNVTINFVIRGMRVKEEFLL